MTMTDKMPEEEARLLFQDCRDALFTARLLRTLQDVRDQNKDLNEIIRQVEKDNGFKEPVPLVNQSVLLSMVYMTLVYPRQGFLPEMQEDWKPRLEWKDVVVIQDDPDKKGNKRFENEGKRWAQLLRTVRNALAHSKVFIGENSFEFHDGPPRGAITTRVSFSWDFLGQLTTDFFCAANDVLYPGWRESQNSAPRCCRASTRQLPR